MNYFIALITEDEMFEWCILQTADKDYAYKVFKDLSAPPGYNMELRCTTEDIETYRTYDVLGYNHS